MKLEKQVTSVKLSNKLHELGITMPSIFYRDWTGSKEDEILMNKKPDYCPDNINCYTVAELGEMLPLQYFTMKMKDGWCGFECWEKTIIEKEKTEVNARAKMLIYLKENKLI